MKSLALLVFATLAFSGPLRADTEPIITNWNVDQAFVPVGFDDNDKVQITVEGTFPSTCYKVGPYDVRTDEESRTMFLYQRAYKYGGTCLRMIVPFAQTMDIGMVKPGDYSLVDGYTGKSLGKLPVLVASNPGPDDFLYAPITDAWVTINETTRETTLNLTGTFTNRCTKLKEVKVNYNGNVIIVLPIAEHVSRCEDAKSRFQYKMRLQDGLQGTYLLHVRSMNGQAINKLTDLQ